MTVAWVDASAGASGDMLLGALVGAGADLAVLQAAVDALGTEPVRLTASSVTRAGLAATKVEVAAPASDVRRTWPDIRTVIEGADLAAPVRDLALDVFARLARAEAAAHGIPADDVHFHEVGALDSLADVVGGLTGVPLVAVPTSVGYGTSYGGLAALLAMLNSCAPGVVVCNIDNGFGAGVFAARVARRAAVRAPA